MSPADAAEGHSWVYTAVYLALDKQSNDAEAVARARAIEAGREIGMRDMLARRSTCQKTVASPAQLEMRFGARPPLSLRITLDRPADA